MLVEIHVGHADEELGTTSVADELRAALGVQELQIRRLSVRLGHHADGYSCQLCAAFRQGGSLIIERRSSTPRGAVSDGVQELLRAVSLRKAQPDQRQDRLTAGTGTPRTLLLALPVFGYPTVSLQSASQLALRTGRSLHVLRVLPAAYREAEPSAVSSLVGLTREAERLLVACRETRAWCDEALPQRLPGLHLAVRTGELVSETVRRAHELQADLIVVPPMTGRSGSIVAALARTSGVPVLVARPTDARRSLLAAADLEDETYPVLRRAAELAGEMAAEVLLLHDLHEAPARESSPAPSKAAAALSDPAEVQRQRLLRAAHRWLPRGKVVVTRENDAAHAIVKQATSSGVDTIIVGARPRPWLARRMAQTIAAQVVERAACSVLVVPIDGAEPAHLPSANVVPAE